MSSPCSRPGLGALGTAMVTLAGMPDHAPEVDRLMISIARMAAARIAAARCASITALQGSRYITVAVSDELIRAVDEAQYVDGAGPCLQAVDTGAVVGVPDIETMVQWPSFHQAAPRMGLQASVSVPLFAGRGDAIAALNIYGNDRAAMAPLIAALAAVQDGSPDEREEDALLLLLDDGGRDLVTGYAEALSARATVRLAIELVMAGNGCDQEDAYLSLYIRAVAAGTDLGAVATEVVERGF